MKITKKELLSSALFLLGLLGLLMLSSWFFRPKNTAEAYGMEDWEANAILAEAENTIDVLFLGDSVSNCSIIPIQIWRDHGITSYLCTTPLQNLYYSKEFLYKAFETHSPQLVFLGTSAIFHEFRHQDNVRTAVEYVFPVFRYHDRWKEAGAFPEFASGMKVEYTHQDIYKGYNFSMESVKVEVGDYTGYKNDVEWIPYICQDAVAEIKEFCEKNNAQLILLSEPNAAGAWAPHRHNAIEILAEELELEYLDLNHKGEEISLDWSHDSFDYGDHLNYYGAKKVTAYLGQYMENMGIFVDKRTDVRYESWNESQEAFYQDIGI